MVRTRLLAALILIAQGFAQPGSAEPAAAAGPSKVETGAIPAPESAEASPLTSALRQKLGTPSAGSDEENQRDAAALTAFYEGRGAAPLWVTPSGLNERANSAIEEMRNAGGYGLDAKAFDLPVAEKDSTPEKLAEAELKLSIAALLYARHARGGRIMKPSEQLNSNLDRKPQLIDPKIVLEGLSANDDAGAYLRSLHPKHPQFEKLRQAYLKDVALDVGRLGRSPRL
jgi:L,D-transpeptidase YcbB